MPHISIKPEVGDQKSEISESQDWLDRHELNLASDVAIVRDHYANKIGYGSDSLSESRTRSRWTFSRSVSDSPLAEK